MTTIDIRRLYEDKKSAGESGGYRVFVDRIWPRGVAKEDFSFDVWCKELAPTPALRKWFGHKVQNWAGFTDRYRDELRTSEQQRRLQELLQQAGHKKIILLYGAKDASHNHAVILAQELERVKRRASS